MWMKRKMSGSCFQGITYPTLKAELLISDIGGYFLPNLCIVLVITNHYRTLNPHLSLEEDAETQTCESTVSMVTHRCQYANIMPWLKDDSLLQLHLSLEI